MANTFDPRSSDENDVYEYDNQKNDLVGKLGSAAIAVSSLVSAFAFLSPSAPATSTPAVNLSDSAPVEAGTTQATDPDVVAPAETTSAAPANDGSVNTAAAPASHPRVITSIHNAGPKAHGAVVNAPSATGTPSATPKVDPTAAIGGVSSGNTTAPTSTTAAGGGTGSSTGNTTSPTSASSGGGTSSSTGGNTSSPTSAGSTASGTNGGGNHHEDDDDH
jgi:hypothetical protein